MTNDTRTSDDIERDIVDERAQMSDTINDLQKKFSVDTIVNDLGHMFRDQGGDLSRSITQTVGRNPGAVVLVGVGLAWLFLGQDRNLSTSGAERQSGRDAGHRRTLAGSGHGDRRPQRNEWSTEGPSAEGNRYWYGDDQMSRDRRSQGRRSGSQNPTDIDDNSNGVIDSLRSGASAVSGAVSGAAGDLGDAAMQLTERLSHGLEDFSEEAKSRVVSARRAAHDARLSSAAVMNRGSRLASSFFEDQPLVAGSLAVALGAAIGSALPHSRIEDDVLGESSDRLFAEAEAVFREEQDKAMAVAGTAAADLKGEIGNVGSKLADLLPEGKTVGDVVVDHAADAATRVMDGAMGEAGQQNQGRRES